MIDLSSQRARDEAMTRRFCEVERVTIHRDFGIGDIHVRGERGERLRITADELDAMLHGLGPASWTFTMLAFIQRGLDVARAHPHLRKEVA